MHRIFLTAAAVLLGGLALVGLIGVGVVAVNYASPDPVCAPGSPCYNCPGCTVSPFSGGQPGGSLCPPGSPYCPLGPSGSTGSAGSIEIGDPNDSQINESALREPKGDDADPGEAQAIEREQSACPTCPQLRQPAPAPARSPSAKPAAKPSALVTTDDRPREGAFACQRCRKATVGEQWQELWTDDGTSLMCVCRSCWDMMSPSQREAQLRTYVARANLSGTKLHYAEQAITDFAHR